MSGNLLEVAIPSTVFAAEASIRALFHLAISGGGGLLCHGAGICFDGFAAVALGPSGAGKSTLARLSRESGATLLSDEIVGLDPEGAAYGTPFCSDLDLGSDVLSSPLGSLLFLKKGGTESVEKLSPATALKLLLRQTHRPLLAENRSSLLLQRALVLVQRVGAWELTFRKDPAVGPFLRRWMNHQRAQPKSFSSLRVFQ